MSSSFSRRDFLRWASAGAGAAAVGATVWQLGDGTASPSGLAMPDTTMPSSPASSVVRRTPRPTPASGRAAAVSPGDPGDRRLVVIELNGGNDGLSTLVPYGIGAYRDLRSTTAIDADSVIAIDDEFGFHANLSRLSERGIAAVQGVGSYSPDGSHFEMLRRWWSGDPDGTAGYDTGFLGRLADLVGDSSAAAVALSIGSGSSPALISRTVSTLALPNADAVGYLTGATTDDVMRYAFQQGFGNLTANLADGVLGRWRDLGRQTSSFAAALASMERDDDAVEYPGSTLGNGLRLAADLVSSDNGVRIVHLPMGSDFDTHDGHVERHAELMEELDRAVDAFLSDLERRGVADRVLVMTTSEFGRRAGDRGGNGLDHGTASTALLFGPVATGRFAEHPSLSSLDDDDNLVATVGLDSYYATVAEGWFGVPSSELFDSAPEIVPGLFV